MARRSRSAGPDTACPLSLRYEKPLPRGRRRIPGVSSLLWCSLAGMVVIAVTLVNLARAGLRNKRNRLTRLAPLSYSASGTLLLELMRPADIPFILCSRLPQIKQLRSLPIRRPRRRMPDDYRQARPICQHPREKKAHRRRQQRAHVQAIRAGCTQHRGL